MCGRYSFAPSPKQLASSGLRKPEQVKDWKISFHIAPTHSALVIANDRPAVLQPMIWGLTPHWSPDGANSGQNINARSESILDKPSFREPIRTRRCLVPADSFYEWRTEPGRRKAPYRILLENGDLLFMAGIWDEWGQGPEKKRSFAILTTTPNREMSALHDRMPVIFTHLEEQERWLADIPETAVLEMLHPPADGLLRMYRVSEKLNSPGYDGADLHDPVAEPWVLF